MIGLDWIGLDWIIVYLVGHIIWKLCCSIDDGIISFIRKLKYYRLYDDCNTSNGVNISHVRNGTRRHSSMDQTISNMAMTMALRSGGGGNSSYPYTYVAIK